MKSTLRRNLGLMFVTLLVADQVTKWLSVIYLPEQQPVQIIPGIFSLTLIYNPGAAFGLFASWSDLTRRSALWIVSFVALLVVARFMFKDAKDDAISQYCLVAILSGAIGNIVDRIRLDRVIDFLDFYWKNYHSPAFNLADSAISIGVTVLLIRMIFSPSTLKTAPTENLADKSTVDSST